MRLAAFFSADPRRFTAIHRADDGFEGGDRIHHFRRGDRVRAASRGGVGEGIDLDAYGIDLREFAPLHLATARPYHQLGFTQSLDRALVAENVYAPVDRRGAHQAEVAAQAIGEAEHDGRGVARGRAGAVSPEWRPYVA